MSASIRPHHPHTPTRNRHHGPRRRPAGGRPRTSPTDTASARRPAAGRRVAAPRRVVGSAARRPYSSVAPRRRDTVDSRAFDDRRERRDPNGPLSRIIVATALAAFVAVGLVAAYDVLAGSGSVPASAAESQPARTSIIALPGDTLWSIAERHRGDVSTIRYVDKLVSLNDGPTIHVGQEVILP